MTHPGQPPQTSRKPKGQRTDNRYCATCRRTQSFLDHGPELRCPQCSHQLLKR
jgi:hypothetical protein